MDNIGFQFTKIPTKIMMAMDVNCRSILFTMCQLASYYADEQGIFFRTNADLAQDSQLSEKLVRAVIDSLYLKGIIEVWSVGKSNGKHANKFRLNYNKFVEYEKYSMDELRNPELRIETVQGYNKKGYTPSYLKEEIPNTTQEIPIDSPTISQSTNNIDIINNIDNKNNKENNSNNINIESMYDEIISDLLEKKCSIEQIAIQLASSNWNCYSYFKRCLRNNQKFKENHYNSYLNLFHELNDKYAPN